jgi:hypothetical protein
MIGNNISFSRPTLKELIREQRDQDGEYAIANGKNADERYNLFQQKRDERWKNSEDNINKLSPRSKALEKVQDDRKRTEVILTKKSQVSETQLLGLIKAQRSQDVVYAITKGSSAFQKISLFKEKRKAHWDDPTDPINKLSPQAKAEEKKKDDAEASKLGRFAVQEENIQMTLKIFRG